jgi:hypothetical protein
MGYLEVTNDNLVNQNTRRYEASAFSYQPDPLFFIVVCPKHITVVKTGDMLFNLLDHDKVIAKGFFKKSMYDSRAYIRKI